MTKYDLICTGCGFILVNALEMDYQMKQCVQAGYCNRCPEQAKLEWRFQSE